MVVTKSVKYLRLENFLARDYVEQLLHENFTFNALTLLVGRQEGHLACKQTGCWFVGDDDLTGALHVLQLQL